MHDPQPLARLSEATRMLAEARNLDEVRQIRDMAAAARAYAQAADLGDEAIGYASAIKLDAERKAGTLLAEMKASGERAGVGEPAADSNKPILSDLGVSPLQSSRWQRLARMPEDDYRNLRDRVETRARHASAKPIADVAASEWDEAVQALQTPESLREAAVLRFGSALMGAAETLDRIDPPLTAQEAEGFTITTAAMLRRLNRGRKLEAVK